MPVTLATDIPRGSDAVQIDPGGSGGSVMGASVTEKIGFYGETPIIQRSGAAQATSLVGTASSADVTTAVKAALIEVMDTLAALGLWKGSA
jgi:hypothetical protein